MPTHLTRFHFLSILCCAAMSLIALPAVGNAADDKPTVELTIDFGDGSQLRFTQLAHSDGMTVLDALTAASKHPRGVEFKSRGSGAIAFVSEIGGLKNEAANGRNWIFRVDGKLARVSAGKQEVKLGDEIEWLFTRYEDLK